MYLQTITGTGWNFENHDYSIGLLYPFYDETDSLTIVEAQAVVTGIRREFSPVRQAQREVDAGKNLDSLASTFLQHKRSGLSAQTNGHPVHTTTQREHAAIRVVGCGIKPDGFVEGVRTQIAGIPQASLRWGRAELEPAPCSGGNITGSGRLGRRAGGLASSQ